jgi:hypothetical protein
MLDMYFIFHLPLLLDSIRIIEDDSSAISAYLFEVYMMYPVHVRIHVKQESVYFRSSIK